MLVCRLLGQQRLDTVEREPGEDVVDTLDCEVHQGTALAGLIHVSLGECTVGPPTANVGEQRHSIAVHRALFGRDSHHVGIKATSPIEVDHGNLKVGRGHSQRLQARLRCCGNRRPAYATLIAKEGRPSH